MKPIAIVQHEESVPAGLIGAVLEETDRDVFVIEAWRDASWPSTEDISGLVVMGGTMNVDQLEEYPFLKQSRDLMADSIEKQVPTLGVCLGAQMMARVLGAEVRRASPRNALFSPLRLTPEGSRDPLTKPFEGVEVLQFHEDTFELPEEAVPLATSGSSGLHQAFRYGERAYAIQFHFEVDRSIVEGWLHNIGRRAMLDQWDASDVDLLRSCDAHLPTQTRAGRELIHRFLELPLGLRPRLSSS